MSTYSRRIQTLKILVDGSVIKRDQMYPDIIEEFDQVEKVDKVTLKPRRLLLQVLHSTRALDSSLRVFTASHSVYVNHPSLGGYLIALRDHSVHNLGRLSPSEVDGFKKRIVDKRNRYLHEAGAFPKVPSEIQDLLGEMHACLSRVLTL